MSDNNWYSENEWYAPAYSGGADKKRKKGWTKPRVIGAVILALALIVGSSVIFSQGRGSQTAIIEGSEDDSFFSDEEMPEDWNDFFEQYYDSVQSDVADVNIPLYSGSAVFKASTTPTAGNELSMQQLYSKCADSIVAISGYVENDTGYSWGTGIILSSDGFILTNTHVIDKCDRAVVTLFDDREFEAELVGADGISDVALLKIDASGLPAAAIGDSSGLSVGDKVVAIGNPLGETFRLTMTDGIISAIDRGINYNGHSMTLMQTNAALNEGNSGGALFNMYGQVIGVTNMKMMSAYSSIEGIGFAIPSSTVCQIVNALMENGEVRGRPSIGITVGAIPTFVSDYYQELPDTGLYVSAVSKGSDAEKKGIQVGDIITAVNGTEVSTTNDVNTIKEDMNVGDTMTFDVWRHGETLEIEVALMDTNDIYG